MPEAKNSANPELPKIPTKRYFSIGEVSELCGVKPHVLRYWEQEFPELKPEKRSGNRRCYLYKDVILAREIRHTLYDLGYTIQGARQRLAQATEEQASNHQGNSLIQNTIASLESILETLTAIAK